MNNYKFESPLVDIWYDDNCPIDDDHPFLVTVECQDMDFVLSEEVALASLTKEEAKRIYEYLGQFFGKETNN